MLILDDSVKPRLTFNANFVTLCMATMVKATAFTFETMDQMCMCVWNVSIIVINPLLQDHKCPPKAGKAQYLSDRTN